MVEHVPTRNRRSKSALLDALARATEQRLKQQRSTATLEGTTLQERKSLLVAGHSCEDFASYGLRLGTAMDTRPWIRGFRVSPGLRGFLARIGAGPLA